MQRIAPSSVDVANDAAVVAALRRGDENAFTALVTAYSGALLRLAQDFVRTRAVAEEVVQETWLAVLTGIDRFEGRSSLKTWLFRILVNKAKTRGVREARILPFSSLELDDDERVVPEERFRDADDMWPGHWATPPAPLDTIPEGRLLAREARTRIAEALETLPESQRIVVTLRDVAGWDAEEVCEALGLSDVNQRVLLHRGRGKLRAALESYLEET
ncbi:MAG TPA: sigma-70 family RNA polymerase sigma factor [Gaiellaceae bacterium]|nr:sigma-70 family RNA polymerase sigma factor [Gaiellaceae bacterium]